MIRLAIDAANFVGDHRGMGRIARPVVLAALRDPRFKVTLLAAKRDARALQSEFGENIALCTSRDATRRNTFDVAWFPFNGMRYRCAAPAVVTLCDTFAFTQPAKGLIARWREQAPIRRSARRANRIVTISHWSAHEIAVTLRVKPERITVIHPAPDSFFFPGVGDVLPPNLEGKCFILFVAGPEPRKNAAMLIEACAKVLVPPQELLAVVGTLNERDEERLQTYGVPHVRLHADDTLLRTLYRNAALVAVPSRTEGFGLVATEAMACAAAVIAAAAAALPEATGGDAFFADPSDMQAWSSGIRMLLDDPVQRSALRARAAARYAFADRAKPIAEMLAVLEQTPGCS